MLKLKSLKYHCPVYKWKKSVVATWIQPKLLCCIFFFSFFLFALLFLKYEPQHEKTVSWFSIQFEHKPGCKAILKALNIGFSKLKCSEHKGADQLRCHSEADLRL